MGAVRNGLIVAVIAIAAAGCQNKLAKENRALWEQNREQQSKIDAMASAPAPQPDQAQVATLQGEVAQRDARIAELEAQLREPTPGQANDPQIAGIETSFDQATGNMTVNIPGDVLFDAGRASLKDSSQATLAKIAAAIKRDYPGKHVFVDGHTDSDPIAKTKGMWSDNLDLSAERARSVAKFLTSRGGLPAKDVDTRAFGSTQPKKTKEASRRVEIVVATR